MYHNIYNKRLTKRLDMKLSIVTTLYKSSSHINEFYERISKEAQKITADYEIIFVDDGSPDDSLIKAIALHHHDPKVVTIELSRNFGHHKAIMTGLTHAKGEYIFLIDSDLEEEPELLENFWNEFRKDTDLDVVYGIQESRKGNWFERWSGEAFYKIYNFLSNVKVPKNLITARLFTKKAVNLITAYKERELCLGCIYQDIGLKQIGVKIRKLSISDTTYTLRKKISLMISSIVSFSNKPLWYIFIFGLITTTISGLAIIKLIISKLFMDIAIDGWTSVMVSIWFFGGLIILMLGIIGIYLSTIFLEVKQRPYTMIKNIYKTEK